MDGDEHWVHALLKDFPDALNWRCPGGYSAQVQASLKGSVEVLQVLINARADVNLVTKYDQPPCFFAAKKGHSDALTVLIHAGADVNLVNKIGASSTFIAAQHGHLQALQ